MSTVKPTFKPPTVSVETGPLKKKAAARFDVLIVVVPERCPARVWRTLPDGLKLKSLMSRRAPDSVPQAHYTLQNSKQTAVLLARLDGAAATFTQAETLRKLAQAALAERPGAVAVQAAGFDDDVAADLGALAAEALLIGAFDLPRFSDTAPRGKRLSRVVIVAAGPVDVEPIQVRARANNLARWLGALPPNVLDAGAYIGFATELAESLGAAATVYDESALSDLGAGAFLAVAQGNGAREAGIVHLAYRADDSAAAANVALVGKGIVFDTGGNNLKPFKGMLDMHIDMQGSAVALAVFEALVTMAAPLNVDCWLAITENRIGPDAYKSQDLVRALNGKTVQTIHTDAEGRMALADTLTMAAGEQPSLIVDFATLTGACVTAITTRYAGVFTNRASLHPALKRAGRLSGERVWPFPVTAEFTADLKSENADLVQCTADGAGDHILAACFLNEFVPDDIPWVHVDLSPAMRKDGLGLVSTEVTGFGTRLALECLLGTDANLLSDLDD
ncbi:MAG: leucyl aminopeptidase family protein [Pseudomonadota bacterium]